MKQLVVLSGKGGTGKTSITAALSHLASQDHESLSIVLADADVDAANLEFVSAVKKIKQEDFWGGKIAEIDPDACSGCGLCAVTCRFEAILEEAGVYQVDPIACEGCAACYYMCPSSAISMIDQLAGEWYRSDSRFGPFFHAALRPAQENSGKLVTLIKQQARLLAMDEEYDLVLVDGTPGIGCPVISAISGADLALIVTEPSKAGIHDLQRIIETTDHFGIPSIVCINKMDLSVDGTREIEDFCAKQGIEIVGRIPFDVDVTRAMMNGEPITTYAEGSVASHALRDIWVKINGILKDLVNE